MYVRAACRVDKSGVDKSGGGVVYCVTSLMIVAVLMVRFYIGRWSGKMQVRSIRTQSQTTYKRDWESPRFQPDNQGIRIKKAEDTRQNAIQKSRERVDLRAEVPDFQKDTFEGQTICG